jgi:hypothetical protein
MTYYISLFVYIHIYIKSEFTESFIGGMYRDSRMGVSELRQKRVLRLAKKRQVIEDAQEKVMEEVRRKSVMMQLFTASPCFVLLISISAYLSFF